MRVAGDPIEARCHQHRHAPTLASNCFAVSQIFSAAPSTTASAAEICVFADSQLK